MLISGIQAIVRLLLDQRRLDAARGLDTRIFVSGYQGSPLGGLDQELARAARHLDPAGVVFQPGLNEELAATAVAGSQLLPFAPGRRHAGVTGFWYGKNPGLDRAADAIRHANLVGASALGGAVALIGDDPASKSSTVPSACEQMCQSLSVPLLAPSSVPEILTLRAARGRPVPGQRPVGRAEDRRRHRRRQHHRRPARARRRHPGCRPAPTRAARRR